MGKHEKKSSKKINKKGIIAIVLIGIAFLILSTGSYIYFSFKNNSYIDEDLRNNENGNTGDYKEMEGISNILLVGTDARNLEENSRADAILILTVDNINKKLKLTSIMRDSYVKIPGHGEQKINHAYAIGGITLLRETIQENFKIKLDKYAVINFRGFEKLVDAVGGIEVDVTKAEMNEMNKFIIEENPKDPHLVKTPGFQRLDGPQTLSYVRIRQLGSGDYDRTKRQRKAISLIIDNMKGVNVLKYPMMASKLLPYFKTNMEVSTLLNHAYTVYKINNFTPEQIQIPVTEISKPEVLKNKGWVLLMDREQNAKVIHDFIFEDIKYDVKNLDYASLNKALEGYKEQISTNEDERSKEEQEGFNKKDYEKEIEKNNDEDKVDNSKDEKKPAKNENPQEDSGQNKEKDEDVNEDTNESTNENTNENTNEDADENAGQDIKDNKGDSRGETSTHTERQIKDENTSVNKANN